jgi:hypothetical protein
MMLHCKGTVVLRWSLGRCKVTNVVTQWHGLFDTRHVDRLSKGGQDRDKRERGANQVNCVRRVSECVCV